MFTKKRQTLSLLETALEGIIDFFFLFQTGVRPHTNTEMTSDSYIQQNYKLTEY